MPTFRQKSIVFVISLAATAGVLAPIPWLPLGDSIEMFVGFLFSAEFLPMTFGMMAVFGLLLYWNPGDWGS